jgi:hypothetical protein
MGSGRWAPRVAAPANAACQVRPDEPERPPGRERSATKKVEHRSIKTGKKVSLAMLKADNFYDRETSDACDKNWVHIAEHRDFWREFVVKAAKFHLQLPRPGRAGRIQDQTSDAEEALCRTAESE